MSPVKSFWVPRSFLTHTFSERVENHKGMQMIGEKREKGFDEETLAEIATKMGDLTTLHKLAHKDQTASVLVLHDGVDLLLGKGAKVRLLIESYGKPFDKKFLNTRLKLVQEKNARWNNTYADEAQAPDIPAGKGTVIAFNDAPMMKALREALPEVLGELARGLFAETNLYYDIAKKVVGINMHGDTERRVVVGVRVGRDSMPLKLQWFEKYLPVSEVKTIPLHDGDIYVLSDKAVGHDWLHSSKVTLRHGVGRKAVDRAVGEAKKGAKKRKLLEA